MNIKDGYYRLNPKGNRKWLSLIDPIVFPLDSIQRHYPRFFLQDLIAIIEYGFIHVQHAFYLMVIGC